MKEIQTPDGIVTIRQGQEADALAYRELRLEALRNHPEAFSANYALNEGQPLAFWEKRLRSMGDENMIYFAEAAISSEGAGSLVGMTAIFRGDSPKTQHSGTIASVYVQPRWRGYGIAGGLINECVEWGRSKGISVFKLGVITTNTSAIRCYARCGFKVYGIEPQAIFSNGLMHDELLMAKTD